MKQTPKKHYLTKSRFKLGRECPVKLYYYGKDKYPSALDDDDFMEALAEGGFQVGELAKCYYPGGHDIDTLDNNKALDETNELLKQDNVIIYEAAVKYDNYFIRVDILVKEEKKLHLIEVKAKSINPDDDDFIINGKLSGGFQPYLEDVAFQKYVTDKAFPDYEVIPYLMLADKSVIATENGLNQKFRIYKNSKGRKSVKRVGDVSLEALGNPILTAFPVNDACEILLNDADFLNDIKMFSEYYSQDKRYPSGIKYDCKNCEYKIPRSSLKDGQISGFEECWKKELGWTDEDFEKPHVFDIWNFRSRKYIESGIYLMEQLNTDEVFTDVNNDQARFTTHDRQYFQVIKSCYENNNVEEVHPGLFTEMQSWTFPLHFIDFETSSVAVPFYKGQHPYEMVAFQFSCHTLYEDGHIEHEEWINKEPGSFPNFEFVKALKDVLDNDDGTIFRYAAHENTVLRAIHEQLKNEIISNQYSGIENPGKLREWIDTITQTQGHTGNRNMVDLCDIVKKYYFHPSTNGSNSIKAVLPAALSSSKKLKSKYTKPYNSKNYNNMIWWVWDNDNNKPYNPYKLLPPFEEEVKLFHGSGISAGGAAMGAYNALQFTDMPDNEREIILQALLKYCELDTLAMLMIYEHWNSLR